MRIASWADVAAWGWNGERLLRELIHLDYLTTPRLTDLTEGTAPQWAPVFTNHPDTWRLLIDGDRNVVGYWHYVILFDDMHDRARRGELVDSEVTVDKVKIGLHGVYKAYFTMLAISEPYRGIANTRLLFDSFFEALDQLANNGVFISEIVANAYSDSGIAVCKTFKMECIAKNKVEGFVYAGSIQTVLNHPIGDKFPALRDKYAQARLL
jgi:hypothetical protein